MEERIVILDSTNPYVNIAREYAYYETLKENQLYFLLWQNEPCVVIGRNQNIYSEINLEYIKENNILPVRRFTGGGAVYHDMGNLNFTFISKKSNKDIKKWMTIILDALKNIGISAELQGRNDILVDNKKISGMAWLEDDDRYMIHGTLMVDLDISILSKCLTPNISKFVGKGIKSVKSRVINLKDLNNKISVDSLKKSLIESFLGKYPDAKNISYEKGYVEEKIHKMIETKAWIFGKREKAQIEKSFKIENKPLNIDIYIENDIITDVTIYSDVLDLNKIRKLRDNLLKKKYKDINILNIVNSIFL